MGQNKKTRPLRSSIISSLQIKLNRGLKLRETVVKKYNTSKLIVLPQMRRTFDPEELKLFATQLFFFQMHPITVRRCTEKELRDHLRLTRKLFPYAIVPTIPQLESKKRKDGTYDVLVAGERRLRAFQTDPNWDRKLSANVVTGITSHTSFFLQQVENTAKIPDREDESDMIGRLYYLMKENEYGITRNELAVLINRTPAYTADLVRFSGLPAYIRWFFEKKLLNYSICIQVGSLQSIFDEKRITNEILHIISSRMNTEKAQKYIQARLEEVHSPNLFGDDFAADLDKVYSNMRRKVVGDQLTSIVAKDREYLKVVGRIIEMGLLGKGKPYSEQSPKRQFGLLTEDIVRLLPTIQELYNPQEFEELNNKAKITADALAGLG